MNLAHKIRIYPTERQENALVRACGVARFTYNWGLNRLTELHKSGNNSTWKKVRKEFNEIKRIEFPWVYDSPKDANQYAFMHLGAAFKNFFEKHSKYPVYKKRGVHDSFTLSNDKMKLTDKLVNISVIGSMKLAEKPRFSAKIMSAIVSREANQWFISIQYRGEFRRPTSPRNDVIAIDRGIKTAFTMSDGRKIDVPPTNEIKLRRLNRSLHRKVKGSKNRNKARVKLSRFYLREKNKRLDLLHKLTTGICRENQTIVIQDDLICNWKKNKSFSKKVQSYGLSEFFRQIKYKSEIFSSDLIIVDKFVPTSKTCHACGFIKQDLRLCDRVYICSNCGIVEDRDVNAALSTAGYAGFQACGQVGLWTSDGLSLLGEAGISGDSQYSLIRKQCVYV